jgi:hypothetical protein
MYVYKKTIFEINDEIKKNHIVNVNDQFMIINSYINIYKTFLYKIIQQSNQTSIDVFEKVCKKVNKTNLNNENVVLLNTIIDKLYFGIDNIDYFFDTIQEFFKKMKPIHLKKYEKKMSSEEIAEKLNETPEKFVCWLMS